MFQTQDPATAYQGVYNWPLVGLSVVIAILAAFVALSIADRIAVSVNRRSGAAWASAGALSMGGGIWAMHFIGMVAFSLPCGVRYDPMLTFLSMIPGVLASGVALSIISRPAPGLVRLAFGAVLMGAGIGAMHYAGMAAMRPEAVARYDAGGVALSVLVAVVLAFTALSIRLRLRAVGLTDRAKTVIAAVVMGCAIPGMHYTAMRASVFYPLPGAVAATAALPPTMLALIVGGFGFLVALSALTAASAGEQREAAGRLLEEMARRKALEQDAQNASARLQAIFDAVVDAIVTVDAEGRIRQWSSGAQRIFGYSAEEVIGKSITMMMPEPHGSGPAASIGGFIGTGDAGVVGTGRELTAIRKDGTEFPMELAVSEVKSQDEQLFTGIMRDITERKRAQQDLILARIQAEEANVAKSQFLATMSHEIRTPMNGVLGMASLLAATPLSVQQSRLVANLSRSGQALLGIINDVLDFSKIEAGKLELAPVEFDPCELLADVADLFAEGCSAKGLELIYQVSEETPSRLRGDSARLRQVLVNLVGNAIKFTEHGQVVVELAARRIDADYATLSFTVEDTGIGIEPDKIDRVFKSFEQADQSMRRARGGTGLGLAISRQLVEMMGGKIEVESEFGRGSRFGFTVRCGLCEAGDQAGRVMGRPLKLLLVDTNRASAHALTGYLTRWGLDPTVCRTLAEADAAMNEGGFEAVMLDVKGLGAPGVEFGRRIASGTGAPAVIFLTGMDRLMVDESLTQAGAFALLSKPVRPSELFECLTAAANKADEGGAARFFVRRAAAPALGRFEARLLVAEDNPVNQDVATGILESMGCRVVTAPNGKVAARLFAEERFDLILMDCEMPEMDGLEATRRIRHLETIPGISMAGRRTPIVALTAHALADVHQACLNVGMDDFLTKPFDERQINDALRRWIPELEVGDRRGPQAEAMSDARVGASVAEAAAVIDRGAFENVTAFRGDKGAALLKTVVGKLRESGPALTGDVLAAAAQGDVEALWRAAHSLKSSAGALGAVRLSGRCAQIEALGRAGDLEALKPLLDGLESDLSDALAALAAFVGEPDVRVA
ncbi:MAG TPA: MHYT domain-containing protein [Caulobacteraceae bacterium]|nr:MHYT domain-containing protein [Caulobacteraceae bacterium]